VRGNRERGNGGYGLPAPGWLAFSNNNSNTGCSYYWTFGDGGNSYLPNPVHNYTQSGIFTVTLLMTSQYGCTAAATTNASVSVYISPTAVFTAEPFVASIIDPKIKFINASLNANTHSWDFGDNTASNQISPTHTYAAVGTYVVKLFTTSTGGCADSITRTVIIEPEFTFYIPNAFSPDGNGKNDVFAPKGEEITEFTMRIFDRWGELIYSTDDINKGWDGRAKGGTDIAQEGVYVYQIELRDFRHKLHRYNGHVTLIK
jgi:gliding motility-associated-like protein